MPGSEPEPQSAIGAEGTPLNVPDESIVPANPGSLLSAAKSTETKIKMGDVDLHALNMPDDSGAQSVCGDTDLDALYRGSKSRIQNTCKEVLISLCVSKFKGNPQEYQTKTVPELCQLIHKSRHNDGISDETGKLLKSQLSKSISVKSSSLLSMHRPDANLTVPGTSSITENIKALSEAQLLKLYHGPNKKLKSAKKYFLLGLCAVKFGAAVADLYKCYNQEKILDILHESRLADGIIDDDASVPSNQLQNVLGKETLEEVQQDMENMVLPSWFNKAPKHPGDVKWGKFKANEWKAFCTVNLPFTLGRLWGSKPKSDKHYQMFENFMYLVAAVKIAMMRVLNSREIALYEKYIKLYLTGFIQLYPSINITPYQHLSLHFSTHLCRFGPMHSWRCFAFECYNGIIQGIPSNNKFGKLEESKFLHFCRMQNLRTIFAHTKLPPQLHSIVSLYEARFEVKLHGTLLEDLGQQPKPFQIVKRTKVVRPFGGTHYVGQTMDECYIRTFRKWVQTQTASTSKPSQILRPGLKPIFLSYIEHFGRRFEPGKGGNSYVLFRRPGHQGCVPGHMLAIICVADSCKDHPPQVYAIVRTYQVLSAQDVEQDPYRRHPHCGYLVYNKLEDGHLVVPGANLITHFASTPIQVDGIADQCLHVLALSL